MERQIITRGSNDVIICLSVEEYSIEPHVIIGLSVEEVLNRTSCDNLSGS
jgi:hypothetical protein